MRNIFLLIRILIGAAPAFSLGDTFRNEIISSPVVVSQMGRFALNYKGMATLQIKLEELQNKLLSKNIVKAYFQKNFNLFNTKLRSEVVKINENLSKITLKKAARK